LNSRALLLSLALTLPFVAAVPLHAQCPDATSTTLVSPTNTSTFDYWDEVLQYDEAPPSGATLTGSWNFDSSQHLTGATAITDGGGSGVHGFGFSGASIAINPGDWISVWVLVSTCNPPRQIRIGSNGTYAYFGSPDGTTFTDGTNSWWDQLPQPGVWSRLWVPPWVVGVGSTLTSFSFDSDGGQVWFDRFAKTGPWAYIDHVSTDASSVAVGTPVTISVTAAGVGSIEYQYYLVNATTGAWSLLQDYSAASSYTWTPATAGSWLLRAHVRAAGSEWPFEDERDAAVTVTQ